ncbi:MAG: hypothetical protein OXK82_05600 [Deltaproteobacteria bacterium]|nr:hypothetical protein [Deltaproteobacteria bacterium]
MQRRTELACLQTRAERFRKEALGVATVLEGCLEHPDMTGYPASPLQDSWPSYDDIVSIFEGCRATKQRIAQLEERLRGWRLID